MKHRTEERTCRTYCNSVQNISECKTPHNSPWLRPLNNTSAMGISVIIRIVRLLSLAPE